MTYLVYGTTETTRYLIGVAQGDKDIIKAYYDLLGKTGYGASLDPLPTIMEITTGKLHQLELLKDREKAVQKELADIQKQIKGRSGG